MVSCAASGGVKAGAAPLAALRGVGHTGSAPTVRLALWAYARVSLRNS
jgi:hypothetical protein